jgi:hypothetical protein
VSKLLVHAFSLSIDGYGAGPSQDLQNPLGVGGPGLFDWFLHTRTWQRMHGNADGETGVDDDVAAQGFAGIDCRRPVLAESPLCANVLACPRERIRI